MRSATITCTILLVHLLAASSGATPRQQTGERVDLQTVAQLTFTSAGRTTTRRTQPHAELVCTGGVARPLQIFHPARVDCFNVGINGAGSDADVKPSTSVRWKCVAKLHRSVRISNFAITCEGYDSENDSFILRGSCWIGYRLEYVTGGGQRAVVDAGHLAGRGPMNAYGVAAVLWSVSIGAVGVYSIFMAYRYCTMQRNGYVPIER